MAINSPLKLTRDQLASFLNDFEQIKQFERLFSTVANLEPIIGTDFEYQADNAAASANEALSQIASLQRIVQLLAFAPPAENNNSVKTDYVDFDTQAPVPADKPGRIYWNRDDGTLDLDQPGDTVLQIGQEVQFYARNTSGVLVTNGTPVMFTGTVGALSKLEFGLAVADGSVPSDYMMGVATQDIPNNEFGYITDFGIVRGFNTTGAPYGQVWADGDLLYFDPATPGAWTNVQPQAPNINVPVAVVLNAGLGGSGSIFVRMKVSEALSRLQDVFINGIGTPLAGQVLIYDATNQRWENHYLTAGAGISITSGDGSIVISNAGVSAPVEKTANFTVAANEVWIINNKSGSSCVVTLPTPSTNSGRVLHFQNYQNQTLVSSASNVVPLAGGSAGTAILEAVAGANCTLVSNGTNWLITQYSSNNSLQLE
jgi:hypothetical protein